MSGVNQVGDANSALYLIKKQIGLIKTNDKGQAVEVTKAAIDINGDGKIEKNETIDCDYGTKADGQWGCLRNTGNGAWDYYIANLKYFRQSDIQKVVDLLIGEAQVGLDQKELQLNNYRARMHLGYIGYRYPNLVKGAVTTLVKGLYNEADWVREGSVWALGAIGAAKRSLVESAIPKIKELSKNDPHPYTRWLSCEKLNELNQVEFGRCDQPR